MRLTRPGILFIVGLLFVCSISQEGLERTADAIIVALGAVICYRILLPFVKH